MALKVSALAGSRQVAMTRQSSVQYWRANSNPKPRLAPVMKTVGMFYSFP